MFSLCEREREGKGGRERGRLRARDEWTEKHKELGGKKELGHRKLH